MAPKADKQVELSAIPYFWTKNSLFVSELDRDPTMRGWKPGPTLPLPQILKIY